MYDDRQREILTTPVISWSAKEKEKHYEIGNKKNIGNKFMFLVGNKLLQPPYTLYYNNLQADKELLNYARNMFR